MSWDYLFLNHFKAFDQLHLPLCPLTLLSGFNAAGKSTCIQSLALLHQTARANEWSDRAILNGNSIQLGTAFDVINNQEGGSTFSIGLRDSGSGTKIEWQFRQKERKHITALIVDVTIDGQQAALDKGFRRLIPNASLDSESMLNPSEREVLAHIGDQIFNLAYLSAERLGPRETYPMSTPQQQHGVGTQGEYTAWFLNEYADGEVSEALRQPSEANPRFVRQVSAWLGHFFPGASFELTPVLSANMFTLSFRTSTTGELFRPQNVGYGLTHLLPVLTALLGSKPGSILLLENPEAHLHPSGQAAIGFFIAKIVASGVQVILETHSDHVLSGIRRAVKEHVLAADQAAIHFFKKPSPDNDRTSVETIQIDDAGSLARWPEGFFDQFDKDSSYFANW